MGLPAVLATTRTTILTTSHSSLMKSGTAPITLGRLIIRNDFSTDFTTKLSVSPKRVPQEEVSTPEPAKISAGGTKKKTKTEVKKPVATLATLDDATTGSFTGEPISCRGDTKSERADKTGTDSMVPNASMNVSTMKSFDNHIQMDETPIPDSATWAIPAVNWLFMLSGGGRSRGATVPLVRIDRIVIMTFQTRVRGQAKTAEEAGAVSTAAAAATGEVDKTFTLRAPKSLRGVTEKEVTSRTRSRVPFVMNGPFEFELRVVLVAGIDFIGQLRELII
jgi:hypothetical protein